VTVTVTVTVTVAAEAGRNIGADGPSRRPITMRSWPPSTPYSSTRR